ncbi:hypothetical protein AA309_07045 [Microvirga vignae]|uniref:Uncharacterized protein n=1 Tax=Microvirga vignae TaxID=1225564 RepID=A0A0H1RFZ6_9HYPH|nr:hypothetical protein [Microvirga vignae]KLK93776.1 hypothetical protein AA309_07045 [Microvirga vignae]
MSVFEIDKSRVELREAQSQAPALKILYQSLLTTLTNLDFAYERERETLSSSALNPREQIRALGKLRESHREQRNPYLQQLAILQERIYG